MVPVVQIAPVNTIVLSAGNPSDGTMAIGFVDQPAVVANYVGSPHQLALTTVIAPKFPIHCYSSVRRRNFAG
jgi:hypothetical protein